MALWGASPLPAVKAPAGFRGGRPEGPLQPPGLWDWRRPRGDVEAWSPLLPQGLGVHSTGVLPLLCPFFFQKSHLPLTELQSQGGGGVGRQEAGGLSSSWCRAKAAGGSVVQGANTEGAAQTGPWEGSRPPLL